MFKLITISRNIYVRINSDFYNVFIMYLNIDESILRNRIRITCNIRIIYDDSLYIIAFLKRKCSSLMRERIFFLI